MKRHLNAFGAICTTAILVAFVAYLLHLLPNRQILDIDGATAFSKAELCLNSGDQCRENDFVAVDLPNFPTVDVTDGFQKVTYRILVPAPALSGELPSIFLPRFSDNVEVRLNNQVISPDRKMPEFLHHWNRPFFASFTPLLVKDADNTFEIELWTRDSGQIALHGVYVGPASLLEFRAQRKHVQRLGQVRTYTAVAIFSIIPIFLAWLSHRQSMIFFWVAFNLLFGIVIGFNLSFPNARVFWPNWPVVWNGALLFYCYGAYQYARSHFGLGWNIWQTVLIALACVATASVCVVGSDNYLPTVRIVHALSGAFVILAIALFLANWRRSDIPTKLHVPILLVAAAAGLSDYIFYLVDQEWAFVPRSGLALFVLILGVFAALFNRMARTLNGYEQLNQTMRTTIETRTAELAESQAKIAEIERQKAVDAERERIMFDLHDGVGGQLVNIMAYLEAKGQKDDDLIGSLEEAMRDLSLIIDSLEGSDDLDALFASLKARLDPIFSAHGIDLIWNCEDLPELPNADPSKNLNTIRIVQEAITNSIKHSNAKTITVETGRNSVSVMDDGVGFDPTEAVAKKRGTHSGLGLRGMERRATDIGAELAFQSNQTGTIVKLHWNV